eukprot:292199-Rhodomonas_salina.1
MLCGAAASRAGSSGACSLRRLPAATPPAPPSSFRGAVQRLPTSPDPPRVLAALECLRRCSVHAPQRSVEADWQVSLLGRFCPGAAFAGEWQTEALPTARISRHDEQASGARAPEHGRARGDSPTTL